MKKLFLSAFAVSIASVFFCDAQVLGEKPLLPNVNTAADKAVALSTLWSEIKYNFVNIDNVNFDIDSLYRETVKTVLNTDNDIDFYRELSLFMAKFKDGHTQLLGINSLRPYREDDYLNNWPVFLGAVGRHIYCIDVRKDYKDLQFAELVEVNGIPVGEYMEKYVLPLSYGSTETARWIYGAENVLGRGPVGRSCKVKFVRPDGSIVEESMTYSHIAGLPRNDDGDYFIYCDSYWYPDETVSVRWLKGGIAHVAINTFDISSFPELKGEIDDAMNTVRRKAKGVILDLRENSGGSTEVAIHLQMYIDGSDSLRTFGAETRDNLGYGKAQGNYREEYAEYYNSMSFKRFPSEVMPRDRSIQALSCPVVILAGPRTASACEDFLVNIYELPGRPQILGAPTAGSTGAPLVIDLPHGAKARVCTLRETFPFSGKPFTGGIEPDIFVEDTLDRYIRGKDVVLDRALAEISNLVR